MNNANALRYSFLVGKVTNRCYMKMTKCLKVYTK